MTFEEVWKQLEAKDDCYRRAREMAELSIEQLEYAYNSGYEQGKNDRPQGEWNILQKDDNGIHEIECPFCKYSKGGISTSIRVTFHELPYFCECCGADMRVKNELEEEKHD